MKGITDEGLERGGVLALGEGVLNKSLEAFSNLLFRLTDRKAYSYEERDRERDRQRQIEGEEKKREG